MVFDPRTSKAFFLYVAVLLYLSVGAATLPHLEWYAGLILPALALPAGLVSVFWLVVFIATACSIAQLWRAAPPALTLYSAAAVYGGIVFALVLWNYLFFGARDLSSAAILAVAITGSTVALVLALWRIAPRAAAWLLPLLAWMLYATWFNAALSALNAQ